MHGWSEHHDRRHRSSRSQSGECHPSAGVRDQREKKQMSIAPIYTEKSECQDCFKCLRECPVKAIKVQGGCATVVPEYCIFCGHCVEVCPNGAKKVRDDVVLTRKMLESTPRTIASLAPSFICEFPGVTPPQLIAAIKKLGFWGVSETALGAQCVSANT